ncbi:hypothetical protein TBLA_0B05150 [Henningerozyma blattae CBS 6284]|uniref:Probable endonuclease LCL3 n=1 Tax=Henningerozyma blattae (strain ATCC 34711 / CBS 6284 / DSM 70876 / NBRC 10599 / NRRL Y-10934 / UCD 77-7) TaxID=1071380 RepID=I2GYZ6_HENB6|nr:hypothetical protein TBLA_0B05150 [Tetrapisispora blattae CBS 6284]CCH59348.1 hypothetical protein TBLA_0B05150 [Tetrapisispora blattae CBS 6284]
MGDNTSNTLVYSSSINAYGTIVLSLILTGSIFGTYTIFNKYLKQYTKATDIPSSVFKRQWLYGKVTSVGDGDNFHFFHLPGGVLGGWGWLRSVPQLMKNEQNLTNSSKTTTKKSTDTLTSKFAFWNTNKNIKQRGKYSSKHFLGLEVPYKNKRGLSTISVRICGVDAPERAHFGNKTQPFGDEALIWLSHTILNRYVYIKPLSVDQYNRCVSKVMYLTWSGWKNVSVEMVKQGLAIVYEGKLTAEFDGEEDIYRYHEAIAKANKRGVWSLKELRNSR